jgi:hypothetical protein
MKLNAQGREVLNIPREKQLQNLVNEVIASEPHCLQDCPPKLSNVVHMATGAYLRWACHFCGGVIGKHPTLEGQFCYLHTPDCWINRAIALLVEHQEAEVVAGNWKRVKPDPAPRYDDVFYEGTKWLDSL